ncbi:DUF2062 domain-containing protein [Paenibacillus mucilaginosus]|nr:DUF2062 domain-containing protein [Paenibacillus caseinilyticus]MCZ8519340.1 DUF2062 domain-containing protein [Paenibacillus caseinilyticus]
MAKQHFRLRNIGRWFRYKYLLLTRAKGGPTMVALGFSIGLAIEMFTLPTAGLAFFLIFPFVYMLRASMAAALLGFMFGKIIYIPFSFVHRAVGGMLLPHGIKGELLERLPGWLDSFIRFNLKLFVGGVVDGIILGLILFFPVKWLLVWFDGRRKEKRKKRKEQQFLASGANG